tara:strand:- start:4436 stop:4612 length:177 start_codon:yes stop_codon:yes gene_type:complete
MWNINIDESMKAMRQTFHSVKEWDKNLAYKFQGKFKLSNYQMLCLSFAKGFIIGAILL